VAGALNVLIVVTALQLLGLGQSGVGALVLLQRLDRARFIGTVAGDPASSNAADAVVGARLGMRTPWDLGPGSPGLAS
jgi:hypothetical protein